MSSLIAAMSHYVVALTMLYVSVSLISEHPVNRVFIMGKYLTPDGARLVMRLWPLVTLLGLFIFACAVEHQVRWLAEQPGHPQASIVLPFVGWVEAGISVITASLVLLGAVVWGVKRWRRT